MYLDIPFSKPILTWEGLLLNLKCLGEGFHYRRVGKEHGKFFQDLPRYLFSSSMFAEYYYLSSPLE